LLGQKTNEGGLKHEAKHYEQHWWQKLEIGTQPKKFNSSLTNIITNIMMGVNPSCDQKYLTQHSKP
jgi:hypothetical protein